MDLGRLVDDRTDTFCFDDGPNEEGNAGNGNEDGLRSEEMTARKFQR